MTRAASSSHCRVCFIGYSPCTCRQQGFTTRCQQVFALSAGVDYSHLRQQVLSADICCSYPLRIVLDARRVLLPLSRLLHRVQPVHLPSAWVYCSHLHQQVLHSPCTCHPAVGRCLPHVASMCFLQPSPSAGVVSRSSADVHCGRLLPKFPLLLDWENWNLC